MLSSEVAGFVGAMDDRFRLAVQSGDLRAASTVIGVVAGVVVTTHPELTHPVYSLVVDAQQVPTVEDAISIYQAVSRHI
jgi:hypothetical protein